MTSRTLGSTVVTRGGETQRHRVAEMTETERRMASRHVS